jgi:hypothetical protein
MFLLKALSGSAKMILTRHSGLKKENPLFFCPYPFSANQCMGSSFAGIFDEHEFHNIFSDAVGIHSNFIATGNISSNIPDRNGVVGNMKNRTNDFPALAVGHITGVAPKTEKCSAINRHVKLRFPPGLLQRLRMSLGKSNERKEHSETNGFYHIAWVYLKLMNL